MPLGAFFLEFLITTGETKTVLCCVLPFVPFTPFNPFDPFVPLGPLGPGTPDTTGTGDMIGTTDANSGLGITKLKNNNKPPIISNAYDHSTGIWNLAEEFTGLFSPVGATLV